MKDGDEDRDGDNDGDPQQIQSHPTRQNNHNLNEMMFLSCQIQGRMFADITMGGNTEQDAGFTEFAKQVQSDCPGRTDRIRYELQVGKNECDEAFKSQSMGDMKDFNSNPDAKLQNECPCRPAVGGKEKYSAEPWFHHSCVNCSCVQTAVQDGHLWP